MPHSLAVPFAIHPAVLMTTPAGEDVTIDVDLAPIIAALWERGVDTTSCCQGDGPRLAHIGFADPHQAVDFLLDVHRPEDGDKWWEATVIFHVHRVISSVRFPPEKIPDITARLGIRRPTVNGR